MLKDACTVVADETGETCLNLSGNAGMATAGSGDVLSGVLAGILCMFLSAEKKLSPVLTAALGVYVHGAAGDKAAETVGERGMTARDIIRFLPEVLVRQGVNSKFYCCCAHAGIFIRWITGKTEEDNCYGKK